MKALYSTKKRDQQIGFSIYTLNLNLKVSDHSETLFADSTTEYVI